MQSNQLWRRRREGEGGLPGNVLLASNLPNCARLRGKDGGNEDVAPGKLDGEGGDKRNEGEDEEREVGREGRHREESGR